jgi:hypothetical protein
MTDDKILVHYFGEAVAILVWVWIAYRRFVSSKRMPRFLAMPARLLKFCVIILTLGLLAGCSNSDPLAVASGPVFPLNAGHWQPTAADLASPPAVVDR